MTLSEGMYSRAQLVFKLILDLKSKEAKLGNIRTH